MKQKQYRYAQHTPGPWTIDSEGNLYGTLAFIRPFIGAISDDHNDEQTQANRRLIAAAPDLLDALKQCLYRLDEHDPQSVPEALKARAAITKAEGRHETGNP